MKRKMVRKKPKRKQSKVRTIKKKVWKIFSDYIRTRDCLRTTGLPDFGKCISCGRTIPKTLLQAGHFIPGRHNANLFYERGCHAQCYNCNINLKGNTLIYMDKLKELYGEGIIEELRERNKKLLQFTIPDLEILLKLYTRKLKFLKDKKP